MKIHNETIKEAGNVFIRFGEAAAIGGVASLYIEKFPVLSSVGAFVGGLILILAGLYLINRSQEKEQQLCQ
jgi:hypothetical protein